MIRGLRSAPNSRGFLPSSEYRVMRSQAQTPRPDIYQTITSKLVAAIEANPGDPISRGTAAARGPCCRPMPSPAKLIGASTSEPLGCRVGARLPFRGMGHPAPVERKGRPCAQGREGLAHCVLQGDHRRVRARCRRGRGRDRAAALCARRLGVRGRAGGRLPAGHGPATQPYRTDRGGRGVLRGNPCQGPCRRYTGLLPALDRYHPHAG